MNEQLNENLKQPGTWKRIAFMLVFAVIAGLVRILLWAVILLQIASSLLTGSANRNILDLGRKLAAYLYHIVLFLTYNTERMPFPFADWKTTETLDLPKQPRASDEPNQRQ
ncbi:MAG: hypothetical protein Kow0065_00410 [Methylomicrobium sp.]